MYFAIDVSGHCARGPNDSRRRVPRGVAAPGYALWQLLWHSRPRLRNEILPQRGAKGAKRGQRSEGLPAVENIPPLMGLEALWPLSPRLAPWASMCRPAAWG